MSYNPAPAYFAAFLTFLAALISLRFGWRYFTNIKYALVQERRLQAWVVTATAGLPLAFLALWVEIIGRLRLEPMTIHPIEHSHSLERVILNLVISSLSILAAAWVAKSPERLPLLPSPILLVVVAICSIGASLFPMYASWVNWCCEPLPGIFAGFPFSSFFVITAEVWAKPPQGTYTVLVHNFFTASQKGFPGVRFNALFLDVLFWINTTYLWLYLAGWISSKIRRPAGVNSQERMPSQRNSIKL
jgi:hypothetical protein